MKKTTKPTKTNGFISIEKLINNLNQTIRDQEIKIQKKNKLINAALQEDINFFNKLGIKRL